MGRDGDVESDYARSEELQSCSSKDEECLVPGRPRYEEFSEGVDIKNPQFNIGMKFRSFKQFKDAVKKYKTRNHYVMNYKPNKNRKCKGFRKKGCPCDLLASPMVNARNTF